MKSIVSVVLILHLKLFWRLLGKQVGPIVQQDLASLEPISPLCWSSMKISCMGQNTNFSGKSWQRHEGSTCSKIKPFLVGTDELTHGAQHVLVFWTKIDSDEESTPTVPAGCIPPAIRSLILLPMGIFDYPIEFPLFTPRWQEYCFLLKFP